MYPGVLTFAVALFSALALTPAVRYLALRVGFVDHPGARKIHVTPVPLLGGVAIYLGTLLAVALSRPPSPLVQLLAILAGASLLVVVGILDDREVLHHQLKLFVGMPVAAVFLLLSGIRAHVFSALLPGGLGWVLDVVLTLVWVVGITAAFSILDHMDGLCAGVAAVAALFFLVLAVQEGQVLVSLLAAALLGSALGFLRWNFNPARIFMGDGGAMFLGFMLATLGLKLRFHDLSPAVSWLIPVLVLGVPIFDTTLVSVSRLRRGLLPFAAPGKDHTAHRLANRGPGQRGAVLLLYGLSFVVGCLALLVSRLSPAQDLILVAVVALLAVAAIVLLERLPFERQETSGPAGV